MQNDAIDLFDLSHTEARRLAATGAPVFLTVNPVEYHGPHLPLHTDRIVSAGLVRDMHARMGAREPGLPLLVVPDLEIGVDPTPGPGTRFTAHADACRLVREACRALLELGARRVVIMTFHGAPLHALAIEEGITLLTEAGVRAVAPFNLVMKNMLDLDSFRFADALDHVAEPGERDDLRRELRSDFHAGFLETSVVLHYAPSAVDPCQRTLPPCPKVAPDARFLAAARAARLTGQIDLAHELSFAAWAHGWNALRPFPGYTTRPHLATREAGAILARTMVDACDGLLEEVLTGRRRSPPPIMRWAAQATLGGRLAQLARPSDAL